KRDVPRAWPFLLALVLLAIPLALAYFRELSFEYGRWRDSDHPWSSESSDDENSLSDRGCHCSQRHGVRRMARDGNDVRHRGQRRSAHCPQQSGFISAALHLFWLLLSAGKMT